MGDSAIKLNLPNWESKCAFGAPRDSLAIVAGWDGEQFMSMTTLVLVANVPSSVFVRLCSNFRLASSSRCTFACSTKP